jgi:hypothetical protein
MVQSTSSILMIRPANFGFNPETALTNAFQQQSSASVLTIQEKAIEEFNNFVKVLGEKGIDVHVFDDTEDPIKPDAIFPNNWISMHRDGTVIIYPMCTPNRRLEKRKDIVEKLKETFQIRNVIDLSSLEEKNKFLEGTGSMVFDHVHRIAYACISPRTDKELFLEVCKNMNYEGVCFTSTDGSGKEIYHTNVMMCIGEGFALVCMESIQNDPEKALVKSKLNQSEIEPIDLSLEQINYFSGNMLGIQNKDGKRFLVCSHNAANALTVKQKNVITKYCELLPVTISTIETIGGGSARCMIAEIFLPLRN